MSSSTTRPLDGRVSVRDAQHQPVPIPSPGELRVWTSEPDHRVVIRDVDWAFYEKLLDSIPDGSHLQVGFDGSDLEFMSPGPLHDGLKTALARFIELTADELEIPFIGLGQTTWKRPDLLRGIEADECYYFASDKLTAADQALAQRSNDVAAYPNPDLAIEIDISPSEINRPAIYSALGVAEVWRFDGELDQIVIERLTEFGTYQTAESSQFLPVNAREIGRWVLEEDRRAGSAWGRRLRVWGREELLPRRSR